MFADASTVISQFKANSVVIVESLPTNEFNSGKALSEYLNGHLNSDSEKIPVTLTRIPSRQGFIEYLDQLEREARDGFLKPILHIECHGSQSGLVFLDSSEISWVDLTTRLAKLNIETDLNLITVVAACCGADFLSEFNLSSPSPSRYFVSLRDEAFPDQILGGLREFYRALFSTKSLKDASNALNGFDGGSRNWHSLSAEEWYLKLVEFYVHSHCTESAMNDRARKIQRTLKLSSMPVRALGSIRRELAKKQRVKLEKEYFEVFFCLNQLRDGRSRFAGIHRVLQSRLNELRGSKRYLI